MVGDDRFAHRSNRGETMIKNRKAVAMIAAAIAILAIYQNPQGSAGVVHSVLDIALEAVGGVLAFAGALVQ
jgi:hypothetical protein